MTKEQTQHEPDGLMAADYRSMYLSVRDELAAEQQQQSGTAIPSRAHQGVGSGDYWYWKVINSQELKITAEDLE